MHEARYSYGLQAILKWTCSSESLVSNPLCLFRSRTNCFSGWQTPCAECFLRRLEKMTRSSFQLFFPQICPLCEDEVITV
jgi:hypothetical protein